VINIVWYIMLRSTIFKITYLVFFALLTIFGAYFLYRSYIQADINVGDSGDRQLIDFGGVVGHKHIFVRLENKPGEIIVKKNSREYCNCPLSGFESSVKIDGVLDVGSELKLIEISGPVGVHGRSKQYFYLDNNICPTPVPFVKDQVRVYNIYSDQPSFKVADIDGDGFADIAAEYRNYDLNPLVDGIREIYRFDNKTKEFVYLRAENYQEGVDCPGCIGEIK
jgi:hypothetical protein